MGRRHRPRHQKHGKPRRHRIMGNEESTMVSDSTRPSVLEARNIEAVAKYIKKHNARKIVVMVRRLLRPVCTES